MIPIHDYYSKSGKKWKCFLKFKSRIIAKLSPNNCHIQRNLFFLKKGLIFLKKRIIITF